MILELEGLPHNTTIRGFDQDSDIYEFLIYSSDREEVKIKIERNIECLTLILKSEGYDNMRVDLKLDANYDRSYYICMYPSCRYSEDICFIPVPGVGTINVFN